jgi:hypothetical protein
VTHTILQGAGLVLRAERAEGAPDGIYLAECLACPETSGRVDSEPNPVACWAILHTERHGLAHSQFLVTTERHWRVDPRVPGDAPAAHSSGRTRTAGPVRPHVRQRLPGRWEAATRRAAARAGLLSGPFVVSALVTVCVLSGYLFGAAQGTG